MFAKPSNYYAAGARVFAVLAIVFFVLALALNVARIGPSAACPPEGYSAPVPNDTEKEQDDRGVLRIVNVLTGGHEVAIGQPLCVIVAGVAPVSSLLEDRDSARRKRDDAQSLDEKAHRDSDAAAQEAAKLQATADASKRGAKPTADADQQAATSAQALAAAELLAKKQADEELAEAQRKYDAAIAAIGNRKAVELTPFLDGKRAPQATTNVLPILLRSLFHSTLARQPTPARPSRTSGATPWPVRGTARILFHSAWPEEISRSRKRRRTRWSRSGSTTGRHSGPEPPSLSA